MSTHSMDHPTPGPFLGSLIPFAKASENVQSLVRCAAQAREKAYVPYSNFPVGAALLCQDGDVILGCNVENRSLGLSVCAEQTAIVKAISSGKKAFAAIAVVGDSTTCITTPCGRCRQFILEFGNNIEIYCAKCDLKEVLTSNISGLLPYGFNM